MAGLKKNWRVETEKDGRWDRIRPRRYATMERACEMVDTHKSDLYLHLRVVFSPMDIPIGDAALHRFDLDDIHYELNHGDVVYEREIKP